MVKKIQFLTIFLLVFSLGLSLVSGSSHVSVSCQITTADCSDETIFKVSAETNAHAEIPSLDNYAYNVCCQSSGAYDFDLGSSCATGITALKLSDNTNAQVEKATLGNYDVNACISTPDININLECIYTTEDCGTAGYDTCLATISGDTNAHTASCTVSPYPTKVCCKAECKETTETSCTDGIDNDCDGLIDCQDPDCSGSVSGNVKNTDNENIADAAVDVLQGTSSRYRSFTNSLGNYQAGNVLCGTYNMVASAEGYVSSTYSDVNLPPKTAITIDFTDDKALVLGSTCEADCTYAGDNTIHKECSGINGCSFYDSTAAEVCNLAQPGWIRDYSSTQQIQCAEGAPYDKVEVETTVTCEKQNLIKTTKIVKYRGKLVKMIVVTCG